MLSNLERFLDNVVSYQGKRNIMYRDGGIGIEDVLTLQFIQSLDFLPRSPFIKSIISSLNGEDKKTLRKLVSEINTLTNLTFFSPAVYLKDIPRGLVQGNWLRPDGVFETENFFAFIEAKIPGGSFKEHQLVSEFIIVHREAENNNKLPILLLILGEEPPININGQGNLPIQDAILNYYRTCCDRITHNAIPDNEIEEMINSTVFWITWGEIHDIFSKHLKDIKLSTEDSDQTNRRIIEFIINLFERHGV